MHTRKDMRSFTRSMLAALSLVCVTFPGAGHAVWVDRGPAAISVGFGIDPSNPMTVYVTAVGGGSGVYKSTDSGTSYGAAVDAGTGYRGIAVKPDNDQIVLAGQIGATTGPIVKSTDGGASFGPTNGGGNHADWKFSFATGASTVVYAAGLTLGIPSVGVLLKSTDAGDNWMPITIAGDAAPPVYSIAVDPTNPDVVYAGVRPNTVGLNDGIYKTVDGGMTWNRLATLAVDEIDSIAINPVDSRIVFAVGAFDNGRIWRSANGGTTWLQVHNPVGGAGNVAGFSPARGIAINPANSSVIYAAGASGATRVILSTDCGATWANVDPTGINGNPSQVAVDPAGLLVYVLENLAAGNVYTETAVNAATGMCPVGVNPPGGGGGGGGGNNNDDDDDDDGGGGSSGSGGSAVNPLFVMLFTLLALFRSFSVKSRENSDSI